jgi:Uncharacterized enzyme involved in biosynthesis of extracellular polysaccharides, COG2329
MINVGFFYSVKPGHEKEFEETFSGVIAYLLGNNTGLKSAKLYRDVSNPLEYMIFSEWDSKESFSRFIQSRPFRETTEGGKSILSGHPRHVILMAERDQ